MSACNALSALHTAFQAIEREVAYDASWENGTGYFQTDNIKNIAPGERAKSTDPHGRRMVLIGTRLGTAVVFDRKGSRDGVVVANIPHNAAKVFDLSSALSGDQIDFITGGRWGQMTLSHRIDAMFSLVKAVEKQQAKHTSA